MSTIVMFICIRGSGNPVMAISLLLRSGGHLFRFGFIFLVSFC